MAAEPEHEKSASQKLFTRLLPWWAESMERESKEWIATCSKCGNEQSYWEMGGIRWKAKSKGLRIGVVCRVCGMRTSHSVERRPGGSGEGA